MNYIESIESGFKLFDEIDMIFREIGKTDTNDVNIKYNHNKLYVEANNKNATIEAYFEIEIQEVIDKVFEQDMAPEEAIEKLFKEKTCRNAKIQN